MGRTKYSEEERNQIVAHFLRCTREIIEQEGIKAVSIRKVGEKAGFNSATLYLYFTDLDELITLACIGYLENYCRTLAADLAQIKGAYEVYLHTWKVFCRHAFANPRAFYHIFYSKHSKPLEETLHRYYDIYPSQLYNTEGVVREMLLEGALGARNIKLLRELAREKDVAEKDLELINDLTVCYFGSLLEEGCEMAGDIANEKMTERFMTAVKFLIRK